MSLIAPSFLGLVSKSSPKKPRGRNIFKALFCCFRAQHVGQSTSSTELSPYKEEANTIAKVAGSKVVWCQQRCDCHGRERVNVTIAGGQASLACVRSLTQRRPFLCPFHRGPSSSCWFPFVVWATWMSLWFLRAPVIQILPSSWNCPRHFAYVVSYDP